MRSTRKNVGILLVVDLEPGNHLSSAGGGICEEKRPSTLGERTREGRGSIEDVAE
jgi:hypothetical protein